MIKEIKWKNHPILGNLSLNFTKPDGTTYNTILFAGENGTGKTSILESISHFLNLGSMEFFDYIKYNANQSVYKITPLAGNEAFGFHKRVKESDLSEKMIRSNANNNSDTIKSDPDDIRHYGVAYSKARSGFSTRQVDSTKTSKLDANFHDIDRQEDFTFLKQLIIDLYMQDCIELRQSANQKKEVSVSEYKQYEDSCKLSRFQNAFEKFFENIRFSTVNTNDYKGIEILFKKNNNVIKIDDLSTGEKQIVFRGALLLKNLKNLENGTILIDEPELSMHPKWQGKILKFYRNLYTQANVQKAQILFATHSEAVIKSGLEDKNNVLIIMLTENNGIIEPHYMNDKYILPYISASEINYIAFGIPSVELHIELYGYLQNKTNCLSVRGCDKYIEKQTNYYNYNKHYKKYTYIDQNKTSHSYNTLPTYIRNCIDHPDSSHSYTAEELEESINLLIELCK